MTGLLTRGSVECPFLDGEKVLITPAWLVMSAKQHSKLPCSVCSSCGKRYGDSFWGRNYIERKNNSDVRKGAGEEHISGTEMLARKTFLKNTPLCQDSLGTQWNKYSMAMVTPW